MQSEVLQLGLVGKARNELSLPDRALALIDEHVCKLYREDDFRRLARGLILRRKVQRQHFAIYRLVDDTRAEVARESRGAWYGFPAAVIEQWIELEARASRHFVAHGLTSYELLGIS